MSLTKEEKELFGKIAWLICKKGHLEIPAIKKFTKATKKDIKKFFNLMLLKKHRTNTYELTPIGRVLGMKYNSRFILKAKNY